MNSLVSADYGSSSDSNDENTHIKNISSNNYVKNFLRSPSDSANDINDDEDDDSSDSSDERVSDTKKTVLPSASSILLNGNNNSGQVFNNPYKKAEIDQIASLEKHVKMVETDAHTHMKNGKKICWNYRKGRCRFGSNCTYAHDSDLHVAESTITTDKDAYTQPAISVPKVVTGTTTSKANNKKRPGLGDSIIPSKKVIKAYNTLKK
ncbi:putative mediator of RNA polymerase II transcription subunit 26 [Sitodiplosis mosellana]|uniref:putative mediator of RNA polymerase II transcription subunit 26 n=1 Tax=Sitodiplosis mosellana TaxID=263140 RepID=UPI002443F1B4|nr:putative mediator of RNA polymerase II transcription subunit 26 [Sitodiplosis mosellana]